MTGAAKGRKGNGHEKSSRRGCRFAAAGIVIFAATVACPDPAPPLPGTVVRTVEVSPGSRKRKAFPLDQGSGMCDLHLDPVDPWRIRRSWIELQDDQTLWRKVNDYEYQMSYGYAPNEYVVVKGELYKPSAGPGRVPVKLPEFLVTVPKVNLDWDAKHGEASKEHAEDLVPAAILVSPDQADFGTLVVHGPKDDFGISSPDVTLTWDNANKVKVFDGANEIHSGQKFSLMQGVTVALSVQALAPADDVKFTLAGESDKVDGEKAVDVVHCLPVKIELVTPDGDPVNAPVDSGDGQNEFTYSSANPGVLTMNLKAKVTPAQAADRIKDDCLFAVGAIGASAMTWANANPGGKAVVQDGFLTATVTFTGLPAKNSDFGKKQAKIIYGACVCDKNDYEVFFLRDEVNHYPSSNTCPNWFYYWLQMSGRSNVLYAGNPPRVGTMAEVRGMTRWDYSFPSDKTNIFIYSSVLTKTRPYNVGEEMSGIDLFLGTIIHESKHLDQIARADALLPSNGNDSFRYGWSWNMCSHNHWGKGNDGAWGVSGVDDDSNGMIDDAAVIPLFEPGHGDDSCKNRNYANGYNNWPNSWMLPADPKYQLLTPIEAEAVEATDRSMNENDHARQDWSCPGKNHSTVNVWNN